MKYLYGAEVQGIQNFVLESNKLREITGGSEFIEQICTTKFKKILDKGENWKDGLIQGAAGIIRYLFSEEETAICEMVVRNFPFEIQKMAPGITISQAVIKIEGELTAGHISELIRALESQRNNPKLSFLAAPMIAERSRSNGQAAVRKDKENFLSKQQKIKQNLAKESGRLAEKIGLVKESLPNGDMDEISGKGDNKDKWLAVIHSDGNSLGQLIIKANTLLDRGSGNVKRFYSSFSDALNNATICAAKEATKQVFVTEIQNWTNEVGWKIPIRPVLLGGDDLTIIIRAKYALNFSKIFMKKFEEYTKKMVYDEVLKKYGDFNDFQNGITTCTGIAYIKPNYPFHYAENLAQQLCKAAKKVSKNINENCAPSSLLFHQVQSSFVGKWEDIVERELKVKGGSFAAGPYFLIKRGGYKAIAEIQQWAKSLNLTEQGETHTSLKSQIRSLITEYIDNPGSARLYEQRLRQINGQEKFANIGLTGASIFDQETGLSHAWDVIKIATIQQ